MTVLGYVIDLVTMTVLQHSQRLHDSLGVKLRLTIPHPLWRKGCQALMLRYDSSIITADQLMKIMPCHSRGDNPIRCHATSPLVVTLTVTVLPMLL